MQILVNFKQFSIAFQYAQNQQSNIRIDEIFPPLFILNHETKTFEEIQHPKVALLIFKIFNNLSVSKSNSDQAKAFFQRDPKIKPVHIHNWFTMVDRRSNLFAYIEDTPFLCLLKFILSDDFYTNQNDLTMGEILKI